MTLNPEGSFWILGGLYFTLAGKGVLPLPRNIRAWFDAPDRERYRVALQMIGPLFIVVGVALLFGML